MQIFEPGRFQAEKDHVKPSCAKCSRGMYSSRHGSRSCLKCNAQPGEYQPQEGQRGCLACGQEGHEGSYSTIEPGMSEQSSCLCSTNYFTHSSEHIHCKSCLSGARCSGFDRQTGQLLAPVSKRGFYGLRMLVSTDAGAPQSRYAFHKCKPGGCLDVQESLAAENETSHVYSFSDLGTHDQTPLSQCADSLTGFLCHACKPGTFRWLPSSSTCHACFLQDAPSLGKFVSVTVLLLVLFAWVPVVRRIKLAIPSLYSLLPFFQIFLLMLSLGFDWPDMAKWLSVPASVFAINLNLSAHQCFSILPSFATKWALYISVPWCFGALKLAQWVLGNALLAGNVLQKWSWINASNRIAIRNQYVADIIYVFGATMIPCSAKALSIFSCRPLFKTFEGASAGSFLASNPSMLCWEDEHTRLCVFAALFVGFYLVAMPSAIAFVLLWTGRHGVRQDSKDFKAKYGFL